MGYSPQGHKESDRIEQLTLFTEAKTKENLWLRPMVKDKFNCCESIPESAILIIL